MNVTDSANIVLDEKYLRNGETPEQMCRRVSRTIANTYEEERQFFELMNSQKFLPNSPTLRSAGYGNFFFACYNIPIRDDLHSIKTADYWASIVHQSGGGTGFNFSWLRPFGDKVGANHGIASGPISFMKMINYSTGIINQGGYRRGANMGILDITHPDVEKFIYEKATNGGLSNFNLSVAITDDFMKRVLANDKEVWGFVNPRDSKYDGNPKLNPRELMEKIAEAAHHIGCPGVVFTDTWEDGVTSTNPCGEMPLEDWESCNLGSMNLTKYVIDGDFDYTSFNDDVETAVQFLDNAIDKHSALNEQMRAISHKNRKIGLGVMGFADALMMMDIPYGSEDCMTFIDMLMVNMKTAAEHRSRLIGGEWDGRRNKTLLSIAPTGTISIIAGCSSSIEPVFSLVYRRNQLDGELNTLEINPIFKTYINKLIDSPEQRMDIYKRVMNDGSCKNIPQIPLKMRSVFATAHDINWKTHIDVQARFQQWVDNAVSKTINLPKTTTPKDVYDAYIYGWKKHLKGLTVYVDGSHKNQVLNMVDGSCASGVCEM